MTGYGRGAARLGEGQVVVEIRSLNHRFLEVRTRAPRALADASMELEQLVRSRLKRGRVEVQVALEGSTGARAVLDRELARDALRSLAEVVGELAPGEPLPLAVLAAVPDLFVAGRDGTGPRAGAALRAAFQSAAQALDEMRSAEGAALASDLAKHLDSIRAFAVDLRRRAPEVVAAHHERLRERTQRLLGDADRSVDPGRLEQELALVADRADVSEEIARIESHCAQIAKLLETSSDVGRRLDFLLQELGREANTIGAKSQSADMTHVVVEMKIAIERMREQSQNVE
jgi:uncharacterized protein (TIGR00255 family)